MRQLSISASKNIEVADRGGCMKLTAKDHLIIVLSLVIMQVGAKKDYDALLLDNPREVTFLCERAMVNIENDDVPSAVDDLLVSNKSNVRL